MIRLIRSVLSIRPAHPRVSMSALSVPLADVHPKEGAGESPKAVHLSNNVLHNLLVGASHARPLIETVRDFSEKRAGMTCPYPFEIMVSDYLRLLACCSYALVLSCLPVLAKEASAEIGDKNKVSLEIARTEKEIQHGLMERASMPEEHGMVFLFRPARIERFWMGHCLISLDMLFIKNGKILTITHEAPPYTGKDPTQAPLYPTAGPLEVSEVIELNSGYCKRHGVKEGDIVKLELPAESEKKKHD